MNSSLFNEAFLNAAAISQGKEVFEKLLAEKIREWMPKVSVTHHQHFALAMATYNELAIEAAKSGDPEGIVSIVEQFRTYEPMFTSDEFCLFDQKCFNFRKKLIAVSLSKYPAEQEKYAEVSRPYIEKAKHFARVVNHIRTLLDKRALEDTINDWNKIALQWKQAIDQAFPQSDLLSNEIDSLGE
jgi:hypothetical protein